VHWVTYRPRTAQGNVAGPAQSVAAPLTFLILAVGVVEMAVGQVGPPTPASLEGISNCVLEGQDVYISVGHGDSRRRYRYSWSAAIDTLCNTNGYAIPTPEKLRNANQPATVPPISAPSATRNASAGFPEGARELAVSELQQMLEGATFNVRSLSGGGVGRMQYARGGTAYFNGGGFSMSGTWRVESSAVCYQWNEASVPGGCNEVRAVGSQLFAKRLSGEVIRLDK
jgi:hypothetical protein